MKYLFWIFFLIDGACLFAQPQQLVPIWQRQEATDGTANAYTPLILIDSFHNIITCGSTYTPGPATGFITFKYDPEGNKLWERRHQTAGTDFITAAATDWEGSVYVAGVTINSPFGGASNQVVFKYAANGDTLWQYYIQVEQGVATAVTGLMLDENQNLLIFGSYFDTLENRGGLYVQKKTPEGGLVWTAKHVELDNNYGSSNAIWTGNHWVFWGRSSSSALGGTRLLCWQIGTQGETLDAKASVLDPRIISPLHIDQEGSLYLTLGTEFRVIKFTTAAEIEWEFKYPSTFEPHGRLLAFTSDKHLNLYAIGFYRVDLSIANFITIKLANNGQVLWEHNLSEQNLTAGRCVWINQNALLTSGTIQTNPDSNFYDCCFAVYNMEGYITGFTTDLIGKRNQVRSTVPDGSFFYVTGIADRENFLVDTAKQFVCKFSFQDFVSIPEININSPSRWKLSIYPNPFSNRFSVSLDYCGEAETGSLKIINAQGVTVFSQDVPLFPGVQSIDLNHIYNLPSGMYKIILVAGDNFYLGKGLRIP